MGTQFRNPRLWVNLILGAVTVGAPELAAPLAVLQEPKVTTALFTVANFVVSAIKARP